MTYITPRFILLLIQPTLYYYRTKTFPVYAHTIFYLTNTLQVPKAKQPN